MEAALLKSLMQILPDGVIITDPEGCIVEINERAAELLGNRERDIIGMPVLDLHPPVARRKIETLFLKIRQLETSNGIIRDIQHNDFLLDIQLSGVFSNDGYLAGIIVLYRDRTEHNALASELENLQRQLVQEQKLSAIGILASGIAHNLNGPLSVVVGYLDLLFSKNPHLEEIPLVLSQTERMKEIITNMMVKSRHEQDHRKRSLNLNTLLQTELQFLESNLTFKHQIEKTYDFTPKMPEIYGIYSDFSQCFLNIINNAVDAMTDSPVKKLTVRTFADDQNITVEIADTGCGLTPENAARIFDPFFTTKPPVSEAGSDRPTGTGLGLSTTRRIIAGYGGSVEADGAPGKGARFTIVIPIKQNRPPEMRETPMSTGAPAETVHLA